MSIKLKHLMTIVLVYSIMFSFPATAQVPSFSTQIGGFSSGAEFAVGKLEGKPLIRVNIIGGLKAPGVYHIPVDTNLAELIAYAGGAVDEANLEEIRIKSEYTGKTASFKLYNFYKISDGSQKMPVLANNDILQIDVKKDNLARTALWIGIIGSVTTLILSILIFSENK